MSRPGIIKIFLASFIVICTLIISQSFQKRPQWTAPPSADAIINPYSGDTAATSSGKLLFIQHCVACHGTKGKGDGVAGIGLNPPPGNLASQKVQAQTDGAIFWKITEGNPPMASYKTILTINERWQLVNYIRALGTIGKKK